MASRAFLFLVGVRAVTAIISQIDTSDSTCSDITAAQGTALLQVKRSPAVDVDASLVVLSDDLTLGTASQKTCLTADPMTAPLDAAGFLSITRMCCAWKMETFFTRLLESMHYKVCSKPHVQGLMHWFTCVPDMDFNYLLDVIANGNEHGCKFWSNSDKTCPPIEGTMCDNPCTVGGDPFTSALDAVGFWSITSTCCPWKTETFFNLLLESMDYKVCSKPHVQGLMHWFTCVPDKDFNSLLDVIANGNEHGCKFWSKADEMCPDIVGTTCDNPCKEEANLTTTTTTTAHQRLLTHADFRSGTLIIDQPGDYLLTENIEFEPQTLGHFPPPDDSVYSKGNGYWLGFFAAIAITADNVRLDLNGKTIAMSRKFSLIQRFFSIVELGSKPFNAAQGPPQFKDNRNPLISAHNVEIKNGILGLSSHMGIHGNNNRKVVIKDLLIKDFETGGIQLNGAQDVEIVDCTIGPSLGATGSSGSVLGLSTLSQGVLLTRIAQGLHYEKDPAIKELKAVLEDFQNKPQGELDDRHAFLATARTKTGQRLPDGSALYGIVLHKPGLPIHDFAICSEAEQQQLDTDPLENFVIRNVVIKDLHLNSDEVVKMSHLDMPVLGPAGDVVQVGRLRDASKGNAYSGNVLSEAQLRLAELKADTKEALESSGQSEDEVKEALFERFGSTNIPPQVQRWMKGNETWDNMTRGAVFECNGDSMSHFNKGVVGLRLEFISQVELENVTISGLKNFGQRGANKDLCPSPAAGFEYHGSDVRAVSVGGGTGANGLDGYSFDGEPWSSSESGGVHDIVDEGFQIQNVD